MVSLGPINLQPLCTPLGGVVGLGCVSTPETSSALFITLRHLRYLLDMLKIRYLDKSGVITDVDGFDLPTEAFSFGKNVRFHYTSVERGPIWRSGDTLSANPRAVFNQSNASDSFRQFIGYKDGRVYLWNAGAADTDYSVSGYVNSDVETPWTDCALAQVLYVNRSDRVPWYIDSNDTAFTALPAWDSTHRCAVLRAFNDALVAFNITKGPDRFPTMIKTSDIIEAAGIPPLTWDETDPTNNATENTLGQMRGEIVDACALGNAMMIYSPEETWVMRATGSEDVYSYDFLFSKGAINTNCSVEVDGVHYVFGPDDLWIHDGNSPKTISDGKVRSFIYNTLNRSKSDRFFVKYNSNLREVQFFYCSGDGFLGFMDTAGCNRCAVYRLSNGTWSFDDVPNLYHGSIGNVSDLTDWVDVTGTWASSGGSWLELDDGLKTVNVYVGDADINNGLSSTLYAQDKHGAGSLVAAPVDPAANKDAYLERTGMDLDELDADLRDYKHITAVYPQGRVDVDGVDLEFSFGVTDYSGQTVQYEPYQTYDGDSNYRIDFTGGGRFLHYRIKYNDYRQFRLSGFDLEVVLTGGI